ncbi:MAG: Mur ligase family protein [Actinomycetaceae bacterium]|nr:Mur ligase family protein [Actinomycetaceae bacterium]
MQNNTVTQNSTPAQDGAMGGATAPTASEPEQANPGARSFDNKRVAVVGLGKSGMACLDALSRLTHAQLYAFDAREAAVTDALASWPFVTAQVESDPEALARAVMDSQPDMIIPAPAIAEVSPLFRLAREASIPLLSEVELAWRLRAVDESGASAPWLCVTGTNGKTTTVMMALSMLQAAGLATRAVGNIGNPIVTQSVRQDSHAQKVLLCELSSAQLATTYSVEPEAAVVLNIADDHLDWHGSADAYAAAKARIYHNVRRACLYPVDSSTIQQMVDDADVREGARAVGIGLGFPDVGDVGVFSPDGSPWQEALVIDRAFNPRRWEESGDPLFTLADVAHLGTSEGIAPHLIFDAIAAATLVRSIGVTPEQIQQGLRAFRLAEHRIHTVGSALAPGTDVNIRFVDDSKATNAHAARSALASQDDHSVVWIVGGESKGAHFDDLVAYAEPKLAGVVVLGRDQSQWRTALDQVKVPVQWIDPEDPEPMRSAVAAAVSIAGGVSVSLNESGASSMSGQAAAGQGERHRGLYGDGGDRQSTNVGLHDPILMTILLSPAAASHDQFVNYEQRGDEFIACARAWIEDYQTPDSPGDARG